MSSAWHSFTSSFPIWKLFISGFDYSGSDSQDNVEKERWDWAVSSGSWSVPVWWRGPVADVHMVAGARPAARAAPAPMHAAAGALVSACSPVAAGSPHWCLMRRAGPVRCSCTAGGARQLTPQDRPATGARAGSGARKQLKGLRLSASTPVSPVSQPDSHPED